VQDDTVTPMMAQYLEIKAQHQGAILFYRMGDFYEMFFQDAHLAAEALDIALTKRGKHQGEDISMCGVPYHAAEGYLLTLIRKGFRVAIAEQMENPSESHAAIIFWPLSLRCATPAPCLGLIFQRANFASLPALCPNWPQNWHAWPHVNF
jgi:DNA mismatch repair ATPase MutS